MLFQLFHHWGDAIISASLSKPSASEAMYAMGKSSYVFELGVFDHLADTLVTKSRRYDDEEEEEDHGRIISKQ